MRGITFIAMTIAAGVLYGCAASDAPTSRPAVANVESPESTSPVTGVWVGTWKASDTDSGNLLTVTCLQTDAGEWLARFDAVCGRNASFTFDITGREEDGKIVFDQAIDLGAINGGKYTWRGEVTAEKFLGWYKSESYIGTFELDKETSTTGASLQCDVPTTDVAEVAPKYERP